MTTDAQELWALCKALLDDPTDNDTRKVLADWLEEHGMPKAADQQRAWSADDYEEEMRAKYDNSWNWGDGCAC